MGKRINKGGKRKYCKKNKTLPKDEGKDKDGEMEYERNKSQM